MRGCRSTKHILYNTAEAEEYHRNYGGGNEGNGKALHTLGRGAILYSRTNTCEKHHCKKEAKTYAKRGEYGLNEVITVGDIVYCNKWWIFANLL